MNRLRQALPKLPRHAVRPLLSLPSPWQCRLLERAVRQLFSKQIADASPDFLRARWLAFRVDDLNWEMQLSQDAQGMLVLRATGPADTLIHGSLNSFILLAAQREDPDTLFFQRRLVIEGDTDLGLQVKNWLDSIDGDQIPPEWLFPLRCAGEFVRLFDTRT